MFIDGEETQKALKRAATFRPKYYVKKFWPMIAALAAELLTKKRLRGKQLEQLLQAGYERMKPI